MRRRRGGGGGGLLKADAVNEEEPGRDRARGGGGESVAQVIHTRRKGLKVTRGTRVDSELDQKERGRMLCIYQFIYYFVTVHP